MSVFQSCINFFNSLSLLWVSREIKSVILITNIFSCGGIRHFPIQDFMDKEQIKFYFTAYNIHGCICSWKFLIDGKISEYVILMIIADSDDNLLTR